MMTAEQLKGSLLLLAVEGRLVPQNKADTDIKPLIDSLRKKQQHLIREKAIKKEKMDTEISTEIDVPDGWCVFKLGEITSVVTKQTGFDYSKTIKPNLSEVKLDDNYIPFLQTKNFKGNDFDFDTDYYIPVDVAKQFPKIILDSQCLLLSIVGASIGNIGIYDGNTLAMLGGAICKVKLLDERLYRYLFYYLQSPLGQYEVKKNLKATAQGTITVQDVREIIIKLPPLEEQDRIVKKLEKLMPFVEQYETASTKLNTLNTTFPEMMKKSILQEAVQGKLVPQDPNDEPASVLLKKITEEKNRLIKEGKIKKQKPLPEISEDEIPFDIPESWEWVRLGTILTLLTDGTHKTPHYVEEGIPFISVKDMSSGKISFSNTKFITEKEADEINMRCNPQRGDILLSKVGTTGVPAPVDTDIKFSLFVSVALLKFNNDFINREYLINAICSPCVQKQCAENTRGVGNKNWVMRDIANTLIPIAPLREQESIVSELKRIIPSFASLEQKIH